MTLPTDPIWPALDGGALAPTLSALHLWSQVVGKVRLELTPWTNHSWHVPLYVSSRGLTTSLIHSAGRGFELEFDLSAGNLVGRSTDGRSHAFPLDPQSVAQFYVSVTSLLENLRVDVEIDCMPCEIADAQAFDEDHEVRPFDLLSAQEYWRALVQIHRVMQLFRSRFVGKCSPIHLFWGSFDLAITRFSGRSAPRHPGGMVHTPDAVARDAYSQEVSSAGFWPGDGAELGPTFYSYAYPSPPAFATWDVRPAAAAYSPQLGEFLMPYDAVSRAPDPDSTLLEFLQSTYEAAAVMGNWDRTRLEGPTGPFGFPP